jgi:type IV secretory pathway ATPase VirB11/archaellum biosynthesis ATPase
VDEIRTTGRLSRELRGDCYRSFLYVIDTGRATLSRLHAASSTLAWVASSPIQQALLDAQAIAVTFERIRRLHFDGGRQLLGLPPLDPTF